MAKNNQKARTNLSMNVEYRLLHCSDCADGECSYAQSFTERDESVPPHGEPKKLFQGNALLRFLLKHGLISPFWQDSRFASIVAPLFGSWGYKRKVSNLVVDAGKAGVASRINGAGSESAFTYIAVGTGTTSPTASDTTLETELSADGLSRASATASRVTTDVTDDSARLVNTFSVTGTQAVTESGMFNAASSGVMLARQTFSAINVENGDSLQITWTIDVD